MLFACLTAQVEAFTDPVLFRTTAMKSAGESKKHVVLISFDGSAILAKWKDSLQFAKENNVHFTYFISAPYFRTRSELKSHPYWADTAKGIGQPFCRIREDKDASGVVLRRKYVAQAISEGHEIGSHLAGHYETGNKWSYEQWKKEFEWSKWAFGPEISKHMMGCRAPYLSYNAEYLKVLKDEGFCYDTSACSVGIKWGKPIELPIKLIRVIDKAYDPYDYTTVKTLPFDCNFIEYVKTHGDDLESIYFDSLCYQYLNGTGPTQVCLHFSKDGEDCYTAMKRFVKWVNARGDGEFITYTDYLYFEGTKN